MAGSTVSKGTICVPRSEGVEATDGWGVAGWLRDDYQLYWEGYGMRGGYWA